MPEVASDTISAAAMLSPVLNASNGDESETTSAILASVKEQVCEPMSVCVCVIVCVGVCVSECERMSE